MSDVTAYTFNNCQLPNIPFSVLLPNPRGLTPATRNNANSASASSGNTNGSVRESRVKSLTINLNTIVEQRTLISLLTGLDNLEDLQLNYMQLNLANFEPDLDSDPTNAASLADDPSISTSILPSGSSSPGSSSTQPLANPSTSFTIVKPLTQGTTEASGLSSSSSLSSSTPSSFSSTTTTTTTTTTPSTTTTTTTQPPATTQLVVTSPASTTSQPPVITQSRPQPTTTTVSGGQRASAGQQSAFPTITMAPPTVAQPTSPTTQRTRQKIRPVLSSSSSVPTTTTTTTSATGSVSASTGGQSTTQSRPLIALGAPRGLMHAQSTGIPITVNVTSLPPASGNGVVGSQPASTTSASHSSTSASSSSSPAPQPASQLVTTMVPSVSLATAAATLRGSANAALLTTQSGPNGSSNNSNGDNQIFATTTHSHHNHHPRLKQQNQSNTISVLQNQPILYTSNTPAPTTQFSGGNFIAPRSSNSQPAIVSTSVSSSVSSSVSATNPQTISPRINNINGQPQTSTPTSGRQQTLITSNSNWQQSQQNPTVTISSSISSTNSRPPPINPSAGMRLSFPTTTTSTSTSGAQNTNNQQFGYSQSDSPSSSSSSSSSTTTATSTTSSPMHWSMPFSTSGGQFRSQSQSPATTTLSSNSVSSPQDLSLLAPVNTPAYAINSNAGNFGIRTPTGSSGNGNNNNNNYNNNQPFRPNGNGNQNNNNFRTFTSTNGNNNNNNLWSLGGNSRRNNQQPPATTTQATGSGGEFIAAGGRLYTNQPSTQGSNAAAPTTTTRRQQFASSPTSQSFGTSRLSSTEVSFADSGASVDGEDFGLRGGGSTTMAASNNQLRRKRRMAEEFELSFGELLPSLKSLKLESFIDLSSSASGKRQPHRQQQRAQARFRRQFNPNDMPEKDESHLHESESDALNSDPNSGETLVADETSVHHNSVMASGDSSGDSSEESSVSLGSSPANSLSSIVERDSPVDFTTSPNSWDQDSSTASSISVVDPQATNESRQQQQQQTQQVQPKVRHLSLLLVKMFSKLNRLKVLQLSSNDIPYWPDNVLFDSRQSLTRLYLISNNLRQMGKSSLANLSELHTLDLSSNQLRQLSGELFKDLSSLKNLRAVRNLFRSLPGKLFARINSSNSTSTNGKFANKLESVDFSKNRYLTQLSADLFASAPAQISPIISLNLSDCSLTDQFAGKSPELLFASLPELVSLSLNGNKFKELTQIQGLFSKNNRLQRLDLSHNLLSQSPSPNLFNANASQILDLQLHHNSLTQIPEQFLFNLRKLKKLSLAYNKLTMLQPKMFFTNQFLEFLDLSHNQLGTLNTRKSSELPFGNGANLKYLNLSHNNLTQFDADITQIQWPFYTNLQVLDLSNNQFQGQVSMPIFYTITDEMLFNLASNQIQSVNVEALMQHEQILDRYASFESTSGDSPLSTGASNQATGSVNRHATHQTKTPTVSIKLTGNPISCDCMLEPLVSYTRRVANALNPSVEASVFAGSPPATGSHQKLTADSRYSVLDGGLSGGPEGSLAKSASESHSTQQPQVFYQFQFNDLYCAQPANLKQKLLRTISIGDLLCPIKDSRLCPNQCQCHYQSAFRRAIVDCDNRQLTQVPDQLTDAANFVQFNIESSYSTGGTNNLTSSIIPNVDKVIIRLTNNQLRSMDQLSKLFSLANSMNTIPQVQDSATGESRNRFARAPTGSGNNSNLRTRNSMAPTGNRVDESSRLTEEPVADLTSVSAQPLVSSSSSSTPATGSSKKIKSPVVMARNLHGTSQRQQRSRRQATVAINGDTDVSDFNEQPSNNEDQPTGELDSVIARDFESSGGSNGRDDSTFASATGPSIDPATGGQETPIMSTAVLESAEQFRTKRYPLTCELYLDHNLIEEFPVSFLEILDQVRSSSMQSTQTPPHAALPTHMLEPPIHAKLINVPDADPIRPSASSTISSVLESDSLDGYKDETSGSHLFGTGRQPLAPERKAALMESINHTVRQNQQRQQQQHQGQPEAQEQQVAGKLSVNPSLVVLSLRYNKLTNVNAKMLQRLSKLIKSSNTKLYLGHNPFNCSDNYTPPPVEVNSIDLGASSLAGPANKSIDGEVSMLPLSPMGDHMMESRDATSGAYLENAESSGNNQDLSSSATNQDPTSVNGSNDVGNFNQIMPLDCPVGQLKTWLTRHHSSIGDLDELYCVHMPSELAERLRLATNQTSSAFSSSTSTIDRLRNSVSPNSVSTNNHDHPWPSTLTGGNDFEGTGNASLPWKSELLVSNAKLIDVDLYDLCPYSGNQLLDASAVGFLSAKHQQVLISVVVIFILISLCLLLMLVYFGDTQTILAFIYIHMNPIYSCLRLNESHLDGEKLYDAFVSYSSADRDIVMELIEKLENDPNTLSTIGSDHDTLQRNQQRQQNQKNGKNITDRSNDTLVTEADLAISSNQNGNMNSLNRRHSSSSFNDLSTMSRSTSRIMMNTDSSDNLGGSAIDVAGNNRYSPNGLSTNKQQQQQQQVPAYRLCIHERDWLPGHLISWNIVNSVQNSRRTILILSKEFIKSVWFQVEFHTAYYQMLEDKIDRLIVIVRGELPPKHELDKNLAFLLTTKTYLTWGEKWFWERLHYALPHRSKPPPIANKRAKQATPVSVVEHHHHYTPKKTSGLEGSKSNDLNSTAARQQQQKPLVMSSIGKDCSNLLFPANNNSQPTVGSASSNGSSSSNTRSSASSFLSGGSSTGNLFNATATTNNDLLSGGISGAGGNQIKSQAPQPPTNQTRLTIGLTNGDSSTNTQFGAIDSGRITATSGSSLAFGGSSSGGGGNGSGGTGSNLTSAATSNRNSANLSQQSSGVTSIMLDGGSGSENMTSTANSRLRAKKQEKLQSFVDKKIADHFNLSEL